MTYTPPKDYYSYKNAQQYTNEDLVGFEHNGNKIFFADINKLNLDTIEYDIVFSEPAFPGSYKLFHKVADIEVQNQYKDYCKNVYKVCAKAEKFYICSNRIIAKHFLKEDPNLFVSEVRFHGEHLILITNDPIVSNVDEMPVEELMQNVFSRHQGKTVYDCCAGSGDVIKSALQNNLKILLSDISKKALFIAKEKYLRYAESHK